MPTHKQIAQFERARWRIAILIPAWLIQLCLAMATLGLFAWRMGTTSKNKHDGDIAGVSTLEFVWEITNIGLSFTIALSTFYETARYWAEALTPWTVLFTQVIKLTCSICILILDIVVYAGKDASYSVVGLVLDVAQLVTVIVVAIYAVVKYYRLSQLPDYAHPANVRNFGFADTDALVRSDSATKSSLRPSLSLIGKRLSSGSFSTVPNADEAVVPLDTVSPSQTHLYSHERDLQFESYVARRKSEDIARRRSDGGSMKDVEDALDAGFWDTRDDPNMNETVLGMGVVPSRKRSASGSRVESWTNNRLLVSVSEEEPAEQHEPKTLKNRNLIRPEMDRRRSVPVEIVIEDFDGLRASKADGNPSS